MLRKDLQAVIDALTDAQIAVLNGAKVIDPATLDAMIQQSNSKDAKANQAAVDAAAALKTVQDKLDATVKQAPVDQASAVDAATGPLIAQIAALTQQVADGKTALDAATAQVTALEAQGPKDVQAAVAPVQVALDATNKLLADYRSKLPTINIPADPTQQITVPFKLDPTAFAAAVAALDAKFGPIPEGVSNEQFAILCVINFVRGAVYEHQVGQVDAALANERKKQADAIQTAIDAATVGAG